MAARKLSLRESFAILGLPESSSEDEVRKTYRLKALECHPDKNPSDPEATRKFQELAEAYHRIQSRNDDDDFSDGIDPFVIFVQTMRMRQFMRNVFHAQFWDDEDEFAFPFGPFGPFGPFYNFARAPNFDGRRSRPSDQSGQSGFNAYSRRSHQNSGSQEEPFRQANKNGTEGFSRTSKHKKSHPRAGYEKPRQAKGPNRGEHQSRQGEQTRSTTPGVRTTSSKYRDKGDCTEEMNGRRSKVSDNNEWDFPETSAESSTSHGERTSGSKENSSDKDQSFSDVNHDVSRPASKSRVRPNPFPQVKPMKKSKKQQRYDEWRRQEEVSKNLETEKETKEGVRVKETSSDDKAEPAFQEKPGPSKKDGVPVADRSSVKQHDVLAGDAVTIDKGSSRTDNSNFAPTEDTTLQERSKKDRPKHCGYGNSGKQTQNTCCDKAARNSNNDKLENEEKTSQVENEGHAGKQRETVQLISEDLNQDVHVPTSSQPEKNVDLNDKPAVIGPGISGKNQSKNRNRRKKAKDITVETEVKPELLLRSKKEKELKEQDGTKLTGKQATQNNVQWRHKTQSREQKGADQTAGGGGGPLGRGQRQRWRNPKKKPGVDAEKRSKTFPNATEKQEETGEQVENEGNNVTLQERSRSSYHKFGVNTPDEHVKSSSTNKAREAKYSKADQSKPGKTNYTVLDPPSCRPRTTCTSNGSQDYEHSNKQKSPKENENERRGFMETSKQVHGPQVYRKPPINDNHQWRPGNKRTARRERKWSAESNRPASYNGKSQAPETAFWDSVMSPDEECHLVPSDEIEEQRQLEIVLELSKKQF